MQNRTTDTLGKLNWDDLRFFLEVVRTRTASGAAKRLNVDHTTVARRIRELESALHTVLFDKSRAGGFVLTAEGRRLLAHADPIEAAVHMAREQFSGGEESLAGHVRVGSTEGFGCFFLAPQIAALTERHPALSVDLLPVPHFVSLSKREADVAIVLERPQRGQYLSTRLCDYRLKLYGTRAYLDRHAPIRTAEDLREHAFISYVDDLAFSIELLYLERTVPGAAAHLRSTSVIAQYFATLQGRALAILPCFMAEQNPLLVPVLGDEVMVTRQFWLSCREDLRNLRRIAFLWDYLRTVAEANQALLMGESSEMIYVDGT